MSEYYLDNGMGSNITVSEESVKLVHNRVGLRGEYTLLYSDFTSIEFVNPGIFTCGYMQFNVPGHKSPTLAGVANQLEDVYTFAVYKKILNEAKNIHNVILENKKKFVGNNLGSVKSNSMADELRELKKLVDEGVLSSDEFDAKKKQLLGL